MSLPIGGQEASRTALLVLDSHHVRKLLDGYLTIDWPGVWTAVRFDWQHERDSLVIVVHSPEFDVVEAGIFPPTLMTRQEVTDGGKLLLSFDA